MSEEIKDLMRPNEDTKFMSDFNEDEVVHIELVCKHKVYPEAVRINLVAEITVDGVFRSSLTTQLGDEG